MRAAPVAHVDLFERYHTPVNLLSDKTAKPIVGPNLAYIRHP